MSPQNDEPKPEHDPATTPAPAKVRSKKKRSGKVELEVDGFKFKAEGLEFPEPQPINEPSPKSWGMVASAVNGKLREISVDLFGVIEDTLKASRQFIRGVGKIPDAAATRIAKAHDKSDRVEGIRQEQHQAGQLQPPKPNDAADRVGEFLHGLSAEGASVEIRQLPDGRQAIVIVRHELLAEVDRIVNALPAPGDPEGVAGTPVTTFLHPRIARVLKSHGICTATDLANRTADELLAIDGFGEKSLAKVVASLRRLGLELRQE